MAQLLMCILDMDRQTHSSNWYQRETEKQSWDPLVTPDKSIHCAFFSAFAKEVMQVLLYFNLVVL